MIDIPQKSYLNQRVVGGILADVRREREAQHAKWGTQRHGYTVWTTVLTEEVGELCKEALQMRDVLIDGDQDGADVREFAEGLTARLRMMRLEAVQVAAVAVAMIEHIDEEIEKLSHEQRRGDRSHHRGAYDAASGFA